jgi:hypothetical protein
MLFKSGLFYHNPKGQSAWGPKALGSFNDYITHTGRTPLLHLFIARALDALSPVTHTLCYAHELHTRAHMLPDASRAASTHSAAHHPLHTHLSTLALHTPTEHCTSTLVCLTRICQHSRNLKYNITCTATLKRRSVSHVSLSASYTLKVCCTDMVQTHLSTEHFDGAHTCRTIPHV